MKGSYTDAFLAAGLVGVAVMAVVLVLVARATREVPDSLAASEPELAATAV